ncbi:MAG TPA: GntR family transcriptional regulator [Chloroflexota bacterium]|nr:GntR family transcriptional regulator [Chloroflexota bacterium]
MTFSSKSALRPLAQTTSALPLDAASTDLRAGHEDLTEKTYRTLRELVVTRAFPPGSKVSAESLSQRFGVSRTTIKGALDQLAGEGLLIVRPQVGTFIRGLTAQDVRDIADSRLMLELYAGRRGVLGATEEQRAELHTVVDQMAPLVEDQEYKQDRYEEFVALDRRLHELVVETAGNGFLQSIHRQISVHVHIASYRSRRGIRRAGTGLEEHRAIVGAYDRRDPGLITVTLTKHIERSRDVALQAMEQLGDIL